ncbi:MAG: Homeodomain-like protein, partial [Podila humilis]
LATRRSWTDEDDNILRKLVAKHGGDSTKKKWLKIATAAVGTRTDVQCRSHFYRYLHTASKGRWDKDEVERLKEAVEEHGEDWHKVAKSLGTRIPPQIQRHYAYSFKKADDGEKED